MLTLANEKEEFGKADLSGSLIRQKEADQGKNESHIANIGRMIEEMENSIRQSLMTIYFDKTKSILNSLRSTAGEDDLAKRDAFRDELMSKMLGRQST